MTSHDVVAKVRRLAGTRKVGHAGTLDPMATGVLVLGTNRATRLLGHLMLTEKSYAATIRLGVGGHLTALRRTAVGPFGLDQARTLDQLAEDFQVLPIADAARRTFPSLDLDAEQAQAVRYGRALELDLGHVGEVAVFDPDGA